MGCLWWALGTRDAPSSPHVPPGCSTEPRCPPGVGSGVCHRSWPFHTKHPGGKTHNFDTARSRWSRPPFEVLFAGHLQAFLITGSLRGASLPPGFYLPALGGEGASPRRRFVSRLESPPPKLRAREGRSHRQRPSRPPRRSILQRHLATRRLRPAALRPERCVEGERRGENGLWKTQRVLFPMPLLSIPWASPWLSRL